MNENRPPEQHYSGIPYSIGDYFPIIKFKEMSSKKEGDCCSICIAEFVPDSKCRVLSCKHLFHSACIDQWLQKSTLCPLCKKDYRLPPARHNAKTFFQQLKKKGSKFFFHLAPGKYETDAHGTKDTTFVAGDMSIDSLINQSATYNLQDLSVGQIMMQEESKIEEIPEIVEEDQVAHEESIEREAEMIVPFSERAHSLS